MIVQLQFSRLSQEADIIVITFSLSSSAAPTFTVFICCPHLHSLHLLPPHAAYPLQNLTISGISRYSISLGQDVTLLCAYDTPGALRQRYHVEWYRGRKPIYNKDTPLPPRYEINDNDFSLTIRNTTVEDSSKGYYCALNVQNVESPDDIYRVGPTFELEINGESVFPVCEVISLYLGYMYMI